MVMGLYYIWYWVYALHGDGFTIYDDEYTTNGDGKQSTGAGQTRCPSQNTLKLPEWKKSKKVTCVFQQGLCSICTYRYALPFIYNIFVNNLRTVIDMNTHE